MAKKNQRRKSVVDAKVQWTLALRVMLHFFVFLLVGAVVGLANQFLSNPLAGASENLSAYWRQSAPLLLTLICLIPIFVRDTLTLSNRIAGPICNMRDKMKRHSEGEAGVPELGFRKGDMWSDVPEVFNAMVAQLRQGNIEHNGSQTGETQSSATEEFSA